MAAEVMTAPEGRIIHKTYAVLSGAAIPQRVHVTQYDESLPVIACTLYKDGQLYTIPDGASVRLRMNKNGLPVYHEAMGIDDARHVVYLEITAQMTVLYGEFAMVIEVETSDGKTAGTSYLRLIVRQNPVQNPELDNIPDYTANSNRLTAEGVKKLQDESSTQQKAIEDKGKKTLESIPADYSTLSGKVDENTSGISKLKEDKIDKPSSADDGKIPRAKKGGVEWVEVGQPTDAQTNSAVTSWLNEHPEATTTVQDGSIEEIKINKKFLLWIKNDYVTPEMFGAIGDGVTDDAKAIQNTINYGASNKVNIEFGSKNYLCESSLTIPNGHTNIRGSDERRTILTFKGTDGIICEANKNGEKFFHMQNVMIKGNAGVGVKFVRMSQNVLLERCIIMGFQTGLYLEKCYANDIKNTLINDSTVYGIYMKNSTVISIYGGGINGKSGTNYYETSCFNNKLSQCDISAYQGSEIDYCVYVKNGFGSIYSFYYEGNYENNLPLIAGICFDTCICCSLVGGSVTNSGNKPAVKLLQYCKNVIIQDVYFYIGNEVKVGTVGISVEPTNYECVIKNCVFYGFEKSIDLKSDVRVVLESIESLSKNYGKINVVNSESVHLRLYNVKQDMLPTTITEEPSSIDLQCISLPYGKNWGGTRYKDEIGIKPTGFVYFDTNEQITQIWNGEQWIDLNGSFASNTYSVNGLNIDVIKKGKVAIVNVVGTLNNIIDSSGITLCNSFSSVVKMENVFRCVTSDHFYSLVIEKSGDVILLPRNVLEIGDIIRCSFTYVIN